MGDAVSRKTYAEEHPEQDPAEGSREVIDHDLRESVGEGSPAKQVEKDKPRGN